MLIDSHCHLDFKEFASDMDGVVKRAHDNGVEYILNACSTLGDAEKIIAVANKYKNVFASVGVHPHEAEKYSDLRVEDLIEGAGKSKKIIAIGECGLDYFYEHSDRAIQKKVFEKHIEAGLDLKMPLMVHTRDAGKDTIEMLLAFSKDGGSAVIHCFTGSYEDASAYLDLGFYISASGIITFKKSEELRSVFAKLPLDRLLVETDAPYLAPEPYRGKICEPAYVKYTAERLAEVLKVDFEKVASMTSKNFVELYKVISLSFKVNHSKA